MNEERKIIGIIPARYDSSRFPGKPLALIQGREMIHWVYENCASVLDYLYVATDDERIFNAVQDFGGKVLMTSPQHRSGTDRCREALDSIEKNEKIKSDIVINIQGDEPLIKPEQLRELISCFDVHGTEVATLIKRIEKDEDPSDPNMVKAVVDKDLKALYFSRSVIPFTRNESHTSAGYRHLGLYAYTSETLRKISLLTPSSLELAESLEQLRWLENGISIQTRVTNYSGMGVDTPEDLKRLMQKLSTL